MNPQQLDLLRHLCRRVRIATEEQAARLMGRTGVPPGAVRRELGGLVSRDFLRRDRAMLRRPAAPAGPLFDWQSDREPPDYGALAWRLNKRWDVVGTVETVYWAGPAARAAFGSGTTGGVANQAALSHDVACTDMLLGFAERHPERVADWVGEDDRKDALARGEKLPDVILYDQTVTPYLVCEVAGAYPKSRLEAFHRYVSETLRLPYELW